MRFELITPDNISHEAKPVEDTGDFFVDSIFNEDYGAIITEPYPRSLIRTVYFSLWKKDDLGIPVQVTDTIHISGDMESGTIVLDNVLNDKQENIQVLYERT